MAYQYNVSPAPTAGQGPSGAVPGQIALPQPAADLGAVYPNLSGSTAKTSGDIMSELRGELSPETLNNISNTAASYGVSSGMPLSGLSRNQQLQSIGLTTEGLQHQGIGDFLAATPVVSKTQTVSPETEADIASRNALFASAPNPAAAAGSQETLFNQSLAAMRPPTLPTARGGTALGGPAVAGQGTRPITPSAPPPGVMGPFGPGAGNSNPGLGSTGFNTPAGNPYSLSPMGGYFGSTGSSTGGGINPVTGQPLTPEEAATMEGITPGSADWNNAFASASPAPAGGGIAGGGTGNPVDDLADVYSSTAQNYTPQNDPWNFSEIND